MVVNAAVVVVFALMLLALGMGLLRDWRRIDDYVTQFSDPKLIFGPGGAKNLVAIAVLSICGGVALLAHVLLHMMM